MKLEYIVGCNKKMGSGHIPAIRSLVFLGLRIFCYDVSWCEGLNADGVMNRSKEGIVWLGKERIGNGD